MSKVVYMEPIDHISGKLSKKSRVTYCYKKLRNYLWHREWDSFRLSVNKFPIDE